MIEEDLKLHPESSISEIANRLPDVVFKDLELMARQMAKDGGIIAIGGRKYRKYVLRS